LPLSSPGIVGIKVLTSREVQSVSGAVVRSTNSVFFFFVNVPIESNWTGLVVTDVLRAVGRGVNLGVGVGFTGVGLGVFDAGVKVAVGVAVSVAVGDGGGPSDIARD